MGRRIGLKIRFPRKRECRFESGSRHLLLLAVLFLGAAEVYERIEKLTPEQKELLYQVEHKIYSGDGTRKLLADDICVIAQQVRTLVLDLIEQGLSEEQILARLAEEYGPSILAIPEPHWFGRFSLWIPAVVGGLGILFAGWYLIRHRGATVQEAPADEELEELYREEILRDL